MTLGKVGRRFTAVLDAEWQGMLKRKWNPKRPLVFAHAVLTKTLGARKVREIRARIDRQLNLWERGIHAGLVWDVLVEGRYQEGRINICVEEEDDCLARSFHITVLSGNLQQAVYKANGREGGGGCLLPEDVFTKTGRPVAYALWEKNPNICVPPMENPTCPAFEEYEEVPETVPLYLLEDNVTWVASSSQAPLGRWEWRRSS